MTIDRSMMMIDDGAFAGPSDAFETRTRQQAIENVNAIRDELRDKGRTPQQIQNNARYQAARAELDQLVQAANITAGGTTPVVPGGGGNITPPNVSGGKVWTATDGQTFDNFDQYIQYQTRLDGLNRDKELDAIAARNEAARKAANVQTATESLRIFLKNLFFDSEDAFIEDVLRAAKGDFELGLDSEVILKKMEDYENPNSLFAKRFAGNVELRKQGIEPLSPEVYLQQERSYREYLNAVGLNDIATRENFATFVGKRIAPTEVARRIENVFDVWDTADTPYKAELERTLGLTGQTARNEVAKVLLLGEKAAAELQKKVATAGVATEARVRGFGVGAAEELGAMGVTREQARTGYENIALTQPRLSQLSEIYTKTTPDAAGLQTELEREQFQGMQSERRRRLAEQEQTSFMGRSGTAGSQSLTRRRAGQI
jgi:hypothetical protein